MRDCEVLNKRVHIHFIQTSKIKNNDSNNWEKLNDFKDNLVYCEISSLDVYC